MKNINKIFPILLMIIITLCACSGSSKKQEENYNNYIKQGRKLYDDHEFETALKTYKKALKISEKIFGIEAPQTAEVNLKLSECAELFGEAIGYIEKAEKIYGKIEDTNGLADVFYHYGLVYSQWREYSQSLEAYETALEFCDKSDGANIIKIKIYLYLAGREIPLRETINYSKEAEELLDTIPEEERAPYVIMVYSSLGNAYYNCDEDILAMKSYEKVILYWEKYEDGYRRTVAKTYDLYGYLCSLFDEYDKAIQSIDQSIEMMKSMDYLSPWERAIPYRHLSIIYT